MTPSFLLLRYISASKTQNDSFFNSDDIADK